MNIIQNFFIIILTSFLVVKNNSVDKPNFILYLSDDQDYLDYGIYGNERVDSEHVDKLASQGLKFTNFHTAQAICAPSRSQLYSGLYPIKNGCYANHIPVKKNTKSVVHHLKDLGYEVVLAGKSHVNPPSVFRWDRFIRNIDGKKLNIKGIENYLKNSKKPFCLIIASDYPHGPYPQNKDYTIADVKKQPYENKIPNFKAGYYQNIKSDNSQLGKILELSDQLNFTENSIFIYASDHGITGKYGLYQKGLKIPFVIRWPGKLKQKTISNSLLTMVDVLPTLVDIAGGDTKSFDGKSFLPILENKKIEVNEYIYGVATRQNVQSTFVFPSRMVSNGKFKLIRNYNSFEVYSKNLTKNNAINHFIEIGAKKFKRIPFEELYNLEKDPYEKNNLAKNKEYMDIKNALLVKLDDWMADQNDFVGVGKMPLIKPTLHRLDENSKWKTVDDSFVGKLKSNDYMITHY